jgi:uncharacterized protein RhaS with RHS repeats
VKGEGNQQDYGMRIYDPRVGRFLSVDPIMKEYPELTPYQFASNTPIWATDLDGLEAKFSNAKASRKEYDDYGDTTLNFLGNSEKFGVNVGIAAYNQIIDLSEDVTNLAISSKGRDMDLMGRRMIMR